MSKSDFWNKDWMETQQKYWKDWSEMSTKAMGGQAPAANPWESAMDHWWQALAPTAPDMSKGFVEKMMEQGKMFFRMAEEFTGNMSQDGAAKGDWNTALEKTFGDMRQAFSGSTEEGDDAMHKMMAFWEMPFDNWQRMVSSLSLTPGDALRNMPHDQVKESLHRFLSAPGLGYSREEQGQYQDLIRRNMDYQRAQQEYVEFFNGLGTKSVERMREKMGHLSGGETVDSARGLYELWVSACEEVYGEQVRTAEYAATHGKLVNTLMALKQRMSIMVDETLGALNMPTRSEVRTLQDRLQEGRREHRALWREIEALKEQVAAGQAAQAPAAAPQPAPKAPALARKAPVRRKTTSKKASTKKTAARKSTAKKAI